MAAFTKIRVTAGSLAAVSRISACALVQCSLTWSRSVETT